MFMIYKKGNCFFQFLLWLQISKLKNRIFTRSIS